MTLPALMGSPLLSEKILLRALMFEDNEPKRLALSRPVIKVVARL